LGILVSSLFFRYQLLKLSLSHFAFLALTAFAWMLFAFYPPWVVVGNSVAPGTESEPKYFGYASIWEPPAKAELRGASVEVDLKRLLMQDLGVLLPIVMLWFMSGPFRREMERAEAQENKYHGPEANQNLSRQLRVILVLVAIGCIVSALLLLREHVNLSRLTGAPSLNSP
jgi:hypothetical protein